MNVFEEFLELMKKIKFDPIIAIGVLTIIVTYIIEMIMVHKGILSFNGNKKKIQRAEKLNHIVRGTRITKWDDDVKGYAVDAWYHAKYEYVINGKKRIYRYMSRKNPPLFLNLYYINNPARVFHDEDKKSSLLDLIIIIFPFVLGILIINLLM